MSNNATKPEPEDPILKEILEHMGNAVKSINDKYGIKCAIFMVEYNGEPLMVPHGHVLDYTELSVFGAKLLRQKIIDRVT